MSENRLNVSNYGFQNDKFVKIFKIDCWGFTKTNYRLGVKPKATKDISCFTSSLLQ